MSVMNWKAEVKDLEAQIDLIKARIKSLKKSIANAPDPKGWPGLRQ